MGLSVHLLGRWGDVEEREGGWGYLQPQLSQYNANRFLRNLSLLNSGTKMWQIEWILWQVKKAHFLFQTSPSPVHSIPSWILFFLPQKTTYCGYFCQRRQHWCDAAVMLWLPWFGKLLVVGVSDAQSKFLLSPSPWFLFLERYYWHFSAAEIDKSCGSISCFASSVEVIYSYLGRRI